MKTSVYRINRDRKSSGKPARLSMEKVLLFLFTVVFSLLIFSQIALTDPEIRASFAANSELDGTPLGPEEFLYSEGTIGFQLLNSNSNYNVKVLVNGDEAARFENSTVSVGVKGGDVVEIDCSESDEPVQLEIVSKSDNVINNCLNEKFELGTNITRLLKVRLKEN